MTRFILIATLIIAQGSSFAQVSDIISVKKKNGRTIKNFYEGTQILYQTKYGDYIAGPIFKIHHDTIYVRTYTIEKMPTQFGTYSYDTLNSFLVYTNYKDIQRIQVYTHRGSMRQKLGVLMMIGGAGYAALNLINGSLFNLPVTDKKNLETLAISTGVFAAGFINYKLFPPSLFSRKTDQIVYINLN